MRIVIEKITRSLMPWYTGAALLVLLLSATSLQAQTTGSITGSLVSEQNAAVINATILLRNTSDSGIYKTTLSNEQGLFSIEGVKDGNYFLEVNLIGFEKISRTGLQISSATRTTDLGVLTLRTATKNLGEVVVKGQVPFIERKLDKTVVNVENSIIGAGSTALEMMDKLPGVVVSPSGQIQLNGKSNVNVFIDGKATFLSSEDLANLLRGTSSSSIQKIEIMAKPSAKFDAGGSGGVINIIRKKNKKEGWNGTVNGSYGQGGYPRYNGGFNMSYKNKAYNLFVSGTYVKTQNFFKRGIVSDIFNGDNTFLLQQVSNSNTITTTKTFTPLAGIDLYLSKRTTLTVSGTGALQTNNVRLMANTDEKDAQYVKTNRLDFNSLNKSKPYNYNASAHLVHQIDTTGKEFSADLDYAHYYSDPQQNITNNYFDANDKFMNQELSLLDGNRKLDIYAAKADYSQPLGNGHLEFGWKSSYVRAMNDNKFFNNESGHNELDSSRSDYTINNENINALYVNVDQQIKKFTIQLGLRGEHTWSTVEQHYINAEVKRNYVQLFPSLFVDYKINDQNILNLKVTRRTDRAAYADMIPFRRPLSATTYFKGNPNLRPQIVLGNEFTYAYKDALFVTVAYEHTKNYITTLAFLDDNKQTVTRIPSNVNKAEVWELDIIYSKKLTNWLATNNTFAIFNQSFKGTAKDFVLDNNGTPTVMFNANNSFFITSKLSAEVAFRYMSQRKMVAETYDGYYSVGAGLKYLVLANRGNIALNASNIFNSENRNSVDHYQNLNQYWNLMFDTRVVTLSFTYRFGRGKASNKRINTASEDEKKRTKVSN